MHRIKRGRYDQNLPAIYSRDLQELVHSLLNVNSTVRPSIKQVMALPLLGPYLTKPLPERIEVPTELAMRKKFNIPLERVVEESDQGSISGGRSNPADPQSSGEGKHQAGKGGSGGDLKPLKRIPRGRPSIDPSSDGEATPPRAGGGAGDNVRRGLFDDDEPAPAPVDPLRAAPFSPFALPSLPGEAMQPRDHNQHHHHHHRHRNRHDQQGQEQREPPRWSIGEPKKSQSPELLQDPWRRAIEPPLPSPSRMLPSIDAQRQRSRDLLVAARGDQPSVLVVEHDRRSNAMHVARGKAPKRELPSMMELVDRYQQRHAGDLRRRPVAVGNGLRPY